MGAGDCGGRLRIRDTAKTVRELFSLFLQITDRPRKMRQYRLNRESILYIEGRRPANTPRGHRKSCRDEFETHSYYQFRPFGTMIAPRRKKMKPQPRFKALAGIFYRGYYEGTSRRLLVSQSVCGERRFASCRVRKQSNVRHTTHIRGFSGTPAKPAFQISRLRRTCNSGFFRKNILTLRFKLTVRKLRYLAF